MSQPVASTSQLPPPPPDVEMDEQALIAALGLEPAPSFYTFSSSRDGAHLLKTVEGRILNNLNDLYVLPVGELLFRLCATFH